MQFGWLFRTFEHIPSGKFVLEYIGKMMVEGEINIYESWSILNIIPAIFVWIILMFFKKITLVLDGFKV